METVYFDKDYPRDTEWRFQQVLRTCKSGCTKIIRYEKWQCRNVRCQAGKGIDCRPGVGGLIQVGYKDFKQGNCNLH